MEQCENNRQERRDEMACAYTTMAACSRSALAGRRLPKVLAVHFTPYADKVPFPGSSMDSFNKAWQQYCRHYFPQLFDMCVANRDQMRVCATFEKATAMPNIQPIEIHSSEVQTHATADTLDQPSKLGVDRFEGNSIGQTAGSLSEQTILDPGFFLVVAGRMLVVIHNPTNAPGPVLAILSSGHRLVATPGTRIGMYTIEPTIMFGQLFLDYWCLDFIYREEASLELKAHPIWMGAALSNPLWMASLGNEQAVMAQEWTWEALQKMADDMVAERPWLDYKEEHESIPPSVAFSRVTWHRARLSTRERSSSSCNCNRQSWLGVDGSISYRTHLSLYILSPHIAFLSWILTLVA